MYVLDVFWTSYARSIYVLYLRGVKSLQSETQLAQIYACCIAQKMKFSMKEFFSKCDQILRKLRIGTHLLKKSLIENFIFCAVLTKFHD